MNEKQVTEKAAEKRKQETEKSNKEIKAKDRNESRESGKGGKS